MSKKSVLKATKSDAKRCMTYTCIQDFRSVSLEFLQETHDISDEDLKRLNQIALKSAYNFSAKGLEQPYREGSMLSRREHDDYTAEFAQTMLLAGRELGMPENSIRDSIEQAKYKANLAANS